jgi:membrane protein DedA with SNARE-associated domain
VIPVIRSFISIPAGVFRMPIGRYTLLTIPGSAVWAFGIAGIGYVLGTHYERFHRAFDIALVAGAVLLVLYLVLRRRSSRLTPRA